jgi:hypothetical protein
VLKLKTAVTTATAISEPVSREWIFNERVSRPIAFSFSKMLDCGRRRGSGGDRSAPLLQGGISVPDVRHITTVRRLCRYP